MRFAVGVVLVPVDARGVGGLLAGPGFRARVAHDPVIFGGRDVVARVHSIRVRLRAYVVFVLLFVLVVPWKIAENEWRIRCVNPSDMRRVNPIRRKKRSSSLCDYNLHLKL